MRWLPLPLLLLLLPAPLPGGTPVAGAGNLREYDTRYYTIYTDLDPADAREAAIRMTRMAEQYISRTRDFSGTLGQPLRSYLFRNEEDYWATGAPRGSAGVYDPGQRVLMVIAGDMGPRTWYRIQHEGFHQFAHAVIRGQLPVWLNEGMADYFGEGLFTGDGLITGIIPQWRLERIRKTLRSGGFRPLPEMMQLSLDEWNSKLAIINYDQGWSMVQFLAHGDGGKYQRALGAFMTGLSRGRSWQLAWRDAFGDIAGFEQQWRKYWDELPDNPTADLYAEATTATLTSFLARALSQKQSFDSIDAFLAAAQRQQLRSHPEDWLPPALLADALEQVATLRKAGYAMDLNTPPGERLARLTCTAPGGLRMIGRFTLRNAHATNVRVELRKP